MQSVVSQRARLRHNAHRTLLVNTSRHDADLRHARRDHAWAVGPNQPRLGVLDLGPDLHHVQRWNAFRDADDQRNARVLSLKNRVSRKRWRHKDHRRIRAGVFHSICNSIEDRPTFMNGTALTGSYTADDFRSIFRTTLCVERSFFAGNSLHDEASVVIYQNCPS